MIALDLLRRFETTYAWDLADVLERRYGLLYCNVHNPLSHDSNHAVLLDPAADPARAIADVTRFYKRHGLQPRLYPALYRGEAERLRGALEAAGYVWAWSAWRLFARPPAGRTSLQVAETTGGELAVRRVRALDAGLVHLIQSDGPAPWTVNALERHLRSESLHLLAGYVRGRPVTMGSLKVGEGLSRVDDVLTRPAHRGKGYARALMRYLVSYHAALTANALYLFAESPTAIRIYKEVGFREQPLDADLWTAWRPRAAR